MTGSIPTADFDRERRRRALHRATARLRAEPDDVLEMLSFDDVVAALGHRGQQDIGVQAIALDSIVGTVGRRRDEFDRRFRPVTQRLRGRWQRVAAARSRGATMPPIEVYRVGELHFVEDGHHRVSVARALGDTTIEARVREVRTVAAPSAGLTSGELWLRHHERVFHERVPLPPDARRRIRLSSARDYAQLAALIEARGFRESHARGRLISRPELAREWYEDQFEPIVAVLDEAGIGGPGTDADRYLRFATLRYLMLHAHAWTDDVVQRLLGALRPPERGDDTLVHQLLSEVRRPPGGRPAR